jgi:hypothetical protein
MRKTSGRAKLRSVLFWSAFGLAVAAVGCSIPFLAGFQPASFVGAALLLIVGLFFVWANGKELRDGNPLDLQLRAAGDHEEVASQLEVDFSSQSFRTGHLFLSRRWLCFVRGATVLVRRVDSLIWAYLETVRHKIQGLIPYRTTYQLVVWDRTGRAAVVILKKNEADSTLASLRQVAPWMLFGYSEVLKESWNNDREDLIAQIDQRRATP